MTKSEITTAEEVIGKIGVANSPEMLYLSCRIVKEHLQDEHGIKIRLRDIIRLLK